MDEHEKIFPPFIFLCAHCSAAERLLKCCKPEPRIRRAVQATHAAHGEPNDEEVMAKWSRSCALCHITGEAGAPVVGDTAEWQRRLQQGEEAIINNVVEGFNSMPPLGYCMACEVSDFRAMVAYMAGLNQ